MESPENEKVIYGLHNGDGVVRYVGQTRKGALARLKSHKSAARLGREGPALYSWMRKYGIENIQFVILHYCDTQDEMNSMEMDEIASRSNLLNHEPGGLHGRPRGKNKKHITHCIRGHAFDEENTIVRDNGTRACRICRRDRSRSWKPENKIGRPKRPGVKAKNPNWRDPKNKLSLEQENLAKEMITKGSSNSEMGEFFGVPDYIFYRLRRRVYPDAPVVARLNMQKAREIRKLFDIGWTYDMLEKEFSTTQRIIKRIISNETWKEGDRV